MIPRRRRRAVRSLRATRPPRGALVVAIMPARARMHVVAPRFKKWCIAGKGTTLKRVRPMKKISVVFAACLFAGSAIALEAAQDTPNQAQSTEPTPEAAAPSPKPAAEAPAPSPKPTAEAPAPSSKPTAEAPTPRRAAKGAKPEVAPEHQTETTSRIAYLRALTAEIRKHTTGTSKLGEGSVTVAFTIGASGRVVSHSVKQSSGSAMTEQANKILASIHTPPPPGGKFSAVQQFRFH